MDFTEEMLRTVAEKVHGTLQLPYGEHVVDLAQPFARLTMVEAIRTYHPRYQRGRSRRPRSAWSPSS